MAKKKKRKTAVTKAAKQRVGRAKLRQAQASSTKHNVSAAGAFMPQGAPSRKVLKAAAKRAKKGVLAARSAANRAKASASGKKRGPKSRKKNPADEKTTTKGRKGKKAQKQTSKKGSTKGTRKVK